MPEEQEDAGEFLVHLLSTLKEECIAQFTEDW